ncbi:Hint domain-containing protein [Roseovarius azorensis]|uniref:Hint domain-containing protein n=1 Tax=Roseovarius azorensis TaxID=1287727 RepID=A0A1H7KHZ4_9RHOB|nr:Hint domain-containing protein [Roseovarius azorensis]SEK86408.1 Hint domain-containing protein [Roseovarius azorensis]
MVEGQITVFRVSRANVTGSWSTANPRNVFDPPQTGTLRDNDGFLETADNGAAMFNGRAVTYRGSGTATFAFSGPNQSFTVGVAFFRANGVNYMVILNRPVGMTRDPGQATIVTVSNVSGASGAQILESPVCFTRGTLIETENGPVPVERLAVGDMLRTLDHGFQPVRLVCHTTCDAIDLQLRPAIRPVYILAGALGNGLPLRDLKVSPQHRMLVSSRIAERMFGTAEVLIPAIKLIGLPGVFIDRSVTEVEYFHVLLDDHEVIFAEGAPSESLLTGPEALRNVGAAARAEIRALFPRIAEAEYVPSPARPIPLGRQQKKLVERHGRNRRPVLKAG